MCAADPEKLEGCFLAQTLLDVALGLHHTPKKSSRSKGTAALHTATCGEEKKDGGREEAKRRGGGTREVGRHSGGAVMEIS